MSRTVRSNSRVSIHLTFSRHSAWAYLPNVYEFMIPATEIDFFQPHPELNPPADVFLLRAITHDWSDLNCIKLLSNLRKAASPSTKLVIFDCLMEPSCKHEYEGAPYLNKDVPFPLLANLGGADIASYSLDITACYSSDVPVKPTTNQNLIFR